MTEPEGTALEGQDQAAGSQESNTGPWAADLEQYFEDESARQAADRYMREKVQPYVTNVESQAKPALELYSDLQENPGATYLELTTDLFGDEAAKAITAYLEQAYGEDEVSGEVTPPANPEAQPQNTGKVDDPRIQEMLTDWEDQRNERLYNSELERLSRENPDVVIHDSLFRHHVVMADGDMDQALASYKQFVSEAASTLGLQAAPNAPTAPPTLGSGVQGGSTPPPTEKKYESVGDAIEDWAAEQRAIGQSIAPPNPGR
jgi:hypothetical protein